MDSLRESKIEVAVNEIQMERPSLRDHGDWSSNISLVISKKAGRNPRELANELVEAIERFSNPLIERMEVAGPGFINFYLSPRWLHDVMLEVLGEGEEGYSRLEIGKDESINLEFVSANPTGPLHAGGGRWGAYGDSLARIFRRCGYQTFTEYYVNLSLIHI